MSSIQKYICITFGVLIIIAGVVAALYYGGVLEKSYVLNVTFDSLEELEVGNPVLLNSYKIGNVVDKTLNQDGNINIVLEINKEHLHFIRSGILVTVDDYSGSKNKRAVYVGVPERAKSTTLLESGSTVEGVGNFNFNLAMAFGKAVRNFNDMSDIFLKQLDSLEKYFNSPEMKKTYKDVEKFLKDLEKASENKAEELIDKYSAKIRKKIEMLADELEKKGYKNEADQLRQKLREELGPDPRQNEI